MWILCRSLYIIAHMSSFLGVLCNSVVTDPPALCRVRWMEALVSFDRFAINVLSEDDAGITPIGSLVSECLDLEVSMYTNDAMEVVAELPTLQIFDKRK